LVAIPTIRLFQMQGVMLTLLAGTVVESLMMLFFYSRSRNLLTGQLENTVTS